MSETRHPIFPLLAVAITLTVAAWILLRPATYPAGEGLSLEGIKVPLRPIKVGTSRQLDTLFLEMDYHWPPRSNEIPAIEVDHFPPRLASQSVRLKKSLFFRGLLPIVVAENERLRRLRASLLTIFSQGQLNPEESAWQTVEQIAARFNLEGDWNDDALRQQLLTRVDVVPLALVLAQAANESAWGTSRFAREGNNLFGQWTWDASKGLIPKDRVEGGKYFVRKFANLRASVRSYLHNINVGHAYELLRERRRELREAGTPLDGLILAEGLTRYSQRGEAYVEEIQNMIRGNRLHQLGRFQLD